MSQAEEVATANGHGMLLHLESVSVHYGAVVALDGVSLGLNAGEIIAVMGPNGAGKSTVLRAILGLAPVTSGTIYWRQRTLQAATHEIVSLGSLLFLKVGGSSLI